jgi:oxygen-independent coproporphyrinogen-3 oxidase
VYWQRRPYLGFGAAAHSFLPIPGGGVRWRNPADPAAYRAALDRGELPAGEVTPLSRREAMGEWFFLGLRLREGVALAAFPQEFGLTVAEAFPGVLDRLAGQGLVEVADNRLRLTPKGLLLANQVFLAFL